MKNLKNKYELGWIEIGFILVIVAAVVIAGVFAWKIGQDKDSKAINSFDECVAAGNPVMESFPEQCAANGQTWTNPNPQSPPTPSS